MCSDVMVLCQGPENEFTLGYGSAWHLGVILNKHAGRSESLAYPPKAIGLVYLKPADAEAVNSDETRIKL